MTVRFKCQSEYQKSYKASRSRSVSPQRCAPLAGLRSDQMGISREPRLQRRRKLKAGGLARSCSSLLCPSDPKPSLAAEPTPRAHRTAPPAALRSRSAHKKEPALEPNPPTPPGAQADSGPAADPGPPAGPRPAAEPEPSAEPKAAGKSAKPLPTKSDSQPQLSRPLTAAPDGQQPSANEVQHALQWRAGLRAGGQRSGNQRSEYNRQFSWKKPAAAASPILTAGQVLRSSSRSVPPFKKHPVPMETEYRRSFQGLAPPAEPRLRKHLEHQQRVPLFHLQTTNKKRREESEKKSHPKNNVPANHSNDTVPPSPQVTRGHRMLTEYETSFRSPLNRIAEEDGATDGVGCQAQELRQQALSYRRRAWGANFSRDHLSQLLSEHNTLWEPTDTTDSATDPPTPRLTSDLCRDPDGCSASPVEALDLHSRSSNSSKRSSVNGDKNTQIKSPQSPAAERHTACGDEEEEDTDEEEGRLPTPRLKVRPVQRTHHDLTTPATGGAILVGKMKNGDESSFKQMSGSAVSMAAGAETPVNIPLKPKEAWSENNPAHHPCSSAGSSPEPKPAASPSSKPVRSKRPSPVAPPLLVSPPQHCIQGTLRNADFQHNGELGLRFRELRCSGGGCGSDEDNRLSVMSWRSAASCSMASAVLERAQKRRENFWGKR